MSDLTYDRILAEPTILFKLHIVLILLSVFSYLHFRILDHVEKGEEQERGRRLDAGPEQICRFDFALTVFLGRLLGALLVRHGK